MREIILDTETTGFKPEEGHRIVEIGAIELLNRLPTGKVFHQYLNPQRDVPKESEAVHGLNAAFLKDKPIFAAISDQFMEFIGDSHLVIHNAAFDLAFINAELAVVRKEAIQWSRVIDTLQLARKKFPMGPNSLDALCRRFAIDNSARTKHGALLDSELLAEVYLELTGGRQTSMILPSTITTPLTQAVRDAQLSQRPAKLPSLLTEEELAAHVKLVADLGPDSLWMSAT